jgi:hypothetical protein
VNPSGPKKLPGEQYMPRWFAWLTLAAWCKCSLWIHCSD